MKKAIRSVAIRKHDYADMLADVIGLLEAARRTSARAINAVMTATYWQMGRRVVEVEQAGAARGDYGRKLIDLLSNDLTKKFGRGFSKRNIEQMRAFYPRWPIAQTPSAQSRPQRKGTRR